MIHIKTSLQLEKKLKIYPGFQVYTNDNFPKTRLTKINNHRWCIVVR